jgi:RES domain-containing protein
VTAQRRFTATWPGFSLINAKSEVFVLTTERVGAFFRVCKPEWADCADVSYSKMQGGRWNPPGEFGALYLNATIAGAGAQARHQHVGRAIGLFDLRPCRRPELASFDVPKAAVIDAATKAGIAALGLPRDAPIGVLHEDCWPSSRVAYNRGLAGVACLSAAEARTGSFVGEQLAYFDSQTPLVVKTRQSFADWYPDQIP